MQGEEHVAPVSESLFPVRVVTGGIIRCIIHFSLNFDAVVREEAAFKISLRPFFPFRRLAGFFLYSKYNS